MTKEGDTLNVPKKKGFRLMLEEALYSEVYGRSRQRARSMTAYIIEAVLMRIKEERRYE